MEVKEESFPQMRECRLKCSNPLAREILQRPLQQGDGWTKGASLPAPGPLLERLRPHVSTKEPILDLLVLEQFLSRLVFGQPRELPESGDEAVILLEQLE